MIRLFRQITSPIKMDIRKYKPQYILAAVILISAIFLRVWGINEILGFYYDQGRDALVIEQLLKGKHTLIGPTTGIEGIFLGPFYYYFLAPGYFLGQGNPVVASYWQTAFIVIAIVVIFLIARLYFSLSAGLFAIFFMAFSFSQVRLDRWLSNPAPATLFSPLTMLLLGLSFKSPFPYLFWAGLSLGVLLQLEASSSFFLVILTLVFIILQRRRFGFKSIIAFLAAFILTLLPQAIFELRHNFVITKVAMGFIASRAEFGASPTFHLPNQSILGNRLELYAVAFLEKLKLNFDPRLSPSFVAFLLISFLFVRRNWSKPVVKIMALWFYGVLLFFIFYNGNYGQINTYYFVTLFPIFFIFVGLMFDWLYKINFLKPFVILLLVLFLSDQLPLTLNYLQSGVKGDTTIALGNEEEAVLYVINDSGGQPYNWDAYVPPVVPFVYTYLFGYYGDKLHSMPSASLVSQLYTIHEMDMVHPRREASWLSRQDGMAKIISSVRFGGIRVEKRERINKIK